MDYKKEIYDKIMTEECPFCRKPLWIGNDTGKWRCMHCNKTKEEIDDIRAHLAKFFEKEEV